MDMQVKTLVKIILYIFVIIIYYYSLNWLIYTPEPLQYNANYIDKQVSCVLIIGMCTLSWLIPLVRYIDDHWNDHINLNKFK